jgi:DNA-binding transcriptional ArsR family regulator
VWKLLSPRIAFRYISYLCEIANDIPVPDTRLQVLKTLASPVRLQVLELLKEPAKHFPPQRDGDLVKDGVCADYIRDRLGIAAATASRHLNLMAGAGLVIATRKKGWTFYRRNEKALSSFTRRLRAEL